MSDFFAGVYGARFPDVVINGGGNPLPGMGGLPTPLHDTADAKINYNSSLLGDLSPYAYGEPGYLSSQTSYLNIPHKIQKIVPSLMLPKPDGTGNFELNHPIDDGDIAFVMRLDRHCEVCTGIASKALHRSGLGTAIDPMINLCTLNYLLAGIQICTQLPVLRGKWDALLHYLDKKRFSGTNARQYSYEDLKHVVRHLIRPFGVAHGSEKQGGQHEGSLSPVTWPVSFVISLTLDGKEANMVNIWHSHDLRAGDELVLRLKPMPLPPNRKYTLNHFPKSLSEMTFSSNAIAQVNDEMARRVPHHPPVTRVWQLVPDLFQLDPEAALAPGHGLALGFEPPADMCWQQEGYWHIARTQIRCNKYGFDEYYFNDLANNLRTGHLDVTFQPTYYALPYRTVGDQVGARSSANVLNVLGESAGGAKREWRGTLRIERGFDAVDGGFGSGFGLSSNADDNVTDSMTHMMTDASMGDNMTDNMFKRIRAGAGAPVEERVFWGGLESNIADALAASAARGSEDAYHERREEPVPLVIASDFHGNGEGMGASMGSLMGSSMGSLMGSSFLSAASSGLTEDIGVFEEAGPIAASIAPIMPRLSAAPFDPQAASGGASSQAAATPFVVPKPVLKSGKRPPARGKGVMGTVLSADGSVTHEASRIL